MVCDDNESMDIVSLSVSEIRDIITIRMEQKDFDLATFFEHAAQTLSKRASAILDHYDEAADQFERDLKNKSNEQRDEDEDDLWWLDPVRNYSNGDWLRKNGRMYAEPILQEMFILREAAEQTRGSSTEQD